jgi:hypothetical protein
MANTEQAPDGHPRRVWGEMLTFIREASGLSREELAARANLSVATIMAYEKGWRSPVRDTVANQIEPVPGFRSNGVLLKLWDQFADAMNYSVFPAWVAELADEEREADGTVSRSVLRAVPARARCAWCGTRRTGGRPQPGLHPRPVGHVRRRRQDRPVRPPGLTGAATT